MTVSYRAFGLTITTAIPCHGVFAAMPADLTVPERPVSIVAGPVPESLPNAVCARPLSWIDASGTALHRIPGIASFLVHRGTITAALDRGAQPSRLPSLLSQVPLLLQACQWGLLPVDATCVAIDGGAVVLAGPPAIGRTTLALALALQGARILADGWCAIDTSVPTQPVALPGMTQLSIWPDTAPLLGLSPVGIAGPSERQIVARADLFEPEPLPVRGIVLLQPVATIRAPQWQRGRGAFETAMRLARSAELTRTLLGEPKRLAMMSALAGVPQVLTLPYGPENGSPAEQAAALLEMLRAGHAAVA